MLKLGYDYKSVVKNSERVAWRLDDVMPEDTRLDFERWYLPQSLVPLADLTFLSEVERRQLNQITSNSYANLFVFVEEYVIAMALQHAHSERFGDHEAVRALCRLAMKRPSTRRCSCGSARRSSVISGIRATC